MKNHITMSRVLVGAALIAAMAAPAAATDTKLKFSDPNKPGRLLVQVGFGDVTVIGADSDEVIVSSDEDVHSESEPSDDGFRRLDGDSGFSAKEADNVVTVTFPNWFPGGRRGNGNADVSITVPRQTNVTIERGGPGDMEVHELTGDLEIRGAIGDIELAGMGGGVLVESVNGDIDATFSALVADRPVSITVVHGDVNVTVPNDARANVKLRTLRGEMLTNFPKDSLETSFENSAMSEDGEMDVNVNVDVNVEQAVERSLKDAEKAQRDAEKAHRKAEKEQEKAARDAAAQARGPGPKPKPHPQAVPMPPMPPMPAMPPMAGGKLVVGALNGGGTEFSVQTITGDIKLQKAE